MQKNHKAPRQRTNGIIAAKAEQNSSQHIMRKHVTVHRAYLAFATVSLGALLLLSLAGCQTPTQPTYGGAMVPPPPTGAIGQPAPYGPVGAPQVSYGKPRCRAPLQRGKAQRPRLPHRHNR